MCATEQIAREVGEHLKPLGFKKDGKKGWRKTGSRLVSRFIVNGGQWGEEDIMVGLVEFAPSGQKRITPGYWVEQHFLAGSNDVYNPQDASSRKIFMDDFLQHSVPFIQKYENFDDVWLDLLEAKTPTSMGGDAKEVYFAEAALEIAEYLSLGDDKIQKARDRVTLLSRGQ